MYKLAPHTPHVKSWLIGKDSDAGRDWGQEEKGTTDDKMAGWHHWLHGCWVWVNSRSWWWTGRPGVLRFMGSQRVGHDWATELNWTEHVKGGYSLVAQLVKNPPAMQEIPVRFLSQQDPPEKGRLPAPGVIGFPGDSVSKESTCNAGDLGLIPGLGRSCGGGHDNPLQYSCLENSMDRGAWWATVHRVTKNWTQLSDKAQHTLSLHVIYGTTYLSEAEKMLDLI